MKNGKVEILFFLSNLLGGGAARTVLNVLKYLDRRKFSSTLAVLDYHEDQPFAAGVPEDVPIIDLAGRARRSIGKISKLLKTQDPDITFSTLPQVNTAVAIAHRLSRSRSRLVLRETNHSEIGLTTNRLMFRLRKYSYRVCNAAVALSKGIGEELVRVFGIPEEKVITIYNPIDIVNILELAEKIPASGTIKGKVNLISCGRLVKQKNYPLLFNALQRIDRTKWDLNILGEGPEEENLKRLVAMLGISDSIHFLGFIKNPYSYMRQADLFVLSSAWEGFGHVIVESMACGTPVLSTDCPHGPAEILDNGTYGWLVPNGDVQSLTDKLKQLMDHREEITRMKEPSLKRANDFTARRIVIEYEEAFLSVL